MAAAAQIDRDELRRLLAEDGAQLVEVLPHREFDEEHLPGAINIPLTRIGRETTSRLDPRRPVIVYCWDALWDLSPRAACRLETLEFDRVFDYGAGKADWLAAGEPTEGPGASTARVGSIADRDAVTCTLENPVKDLAVRLEDRDLAVVVDGRVVLGVVRNAALEGNLDLSVAEVMDEAPPTLRADVKVEEMGARFAKLDGDALLVTTPQGELIGVVRKGPR